MEGNFDSLDMDWSLIRSITKKPDVIPDETSIETGDQLALRCVEQLFALSYDAFMSVPEKYRLWFADGTTTFAFKFQGGIIVSVDSSASMGKYIESGTVN